MYQCVSVIVLSDCLSISDLVDVVEAAWDARTKWYDIGLGLRVSPIALDVIKDNNSRDCNACFREMLKEWLKTSQPTPSWTQLVKVLRSRMVGCEELADRLQSHAVA